jgi:hypothetical protein
MRHEGMKRVFNDVNAASGVVPFTIDKTHADWDMLPPAAKPATQSDLATLLSLDDGSAFPAGASRILPEFAERIYTYRYAVSVGNAVEQLLLKVVEDRSITAWVCANDNIAIMAYRFLTEKGLRIPQDISLAGFDNSAESLRYELTTYDFNMPAIIRAMLDFLLWPSRMCISRRGVNDIRGFLIQRASTRRVVA